MNMKIKIFVIASILLFAAAAFSQEQSEDLFRWFPGKDFTTIVYYDLDKIRDENYHLLIKANPVMQHYHFQNQNKLPEGMLKRARCFACGMVTKVKVINLSIDNPEEKEHVNTSHNGMMIVGNYGDYSLKFTEQGYLIHVYQFDDLELALKQAVGKGELKKIDQEIDGNRVFTFNQKAFSGKKRANFHALALTHELLVAPSFKALSQMYEAGVVAEESFVASDKYKSLKEHLEEFGAAWTYIDHSLIYQAQLEKQIEFHDSESSIESSKKKLEAAGEFTITAVIIDDKAKLMEFRVFKDAATAGKNIAYDYEYEASEWKRKGNLCYHLIDSRELTGKQK